jgi:hypothetical protein
MLRGETKIIRIIKRGKKEKEEKLQGINLCSTE